jgi:hypothetical protein
VAKKKKLLHLHLLPLWKLLLLQQLLLLLPTHLHLLTLLLLPLLKLLLLPLPSNWIQRYERATFGWLFYCLDVGVSL